MIPFAITKQRGTTIHTIQILLIEADTPLEAFEKVAEKLSEGTPSWSDWHEAGSNPSSLNFAGRWSGGIFLTTEQIAKEANGEELSEVELGKNPNHLCFADNPTLAEEVIMSHLGYRKKSMLSDLEGITKHSPSPSGWAGVVDLERLVKDYSPTRGFDPTYFKDGGMRIYYISSLIDLLKNKWTPDSSVYDLEGYTADLSSFFQRVEKNPEKQFLIPVDFHY